MSKRFAPKPRGPSHGFSKLPITGSDPQATGGAP